MVDHSIKAICTKRNCRKKATVFGKFAGGLCHEHAIEFSKEFGVEEFHPEYRDAFRITNGETK
jgi:hypothetical protein